MAATPALSTTSNLGKNYMGRVQIARTTPPVKCADVIARRALGQTKSKIAKDLGMSRTTVDSILREAKTEQDWSQLRAEIVPIAYKSVKNQIDSGDGNLGMRYLEATDLKDSQPKSFTDNRLQLAIGTLMAGTEAAATEGGRATAVDSHGQNFPVLASSKSNPDSDLGQAPAQLSFDFGGGDAK